MYLKKLEIIGFKSFADKTVLDFERGITAIVGPNGCGKSNVSDAVRWVLGEQSAKTLRGSNMQDVIFNGTEESKAMGFAEVGLTLAETDAVLPVEYSEVTVTRRLHRTGESEYFINKSPCRLKDIQDLFRGTGIGSNPYSMIAQGNIDMILSSKPEDRRFVFEEAAGITKFKAQKKEALRKLENTEQNLVRVADIIREVKKQIGVIQRQAAKAQKYKELQDQLKESECLQYQRQYIDLTEKAETQNKDIEAAQKEREQTAGKVTDLESSISEMRVELESLNQALAEKNAEQHILNSDEERLQSQIRFHNERIEESRQKVQQNTLEIEMIEERLKQLDEELKASALNFGQVAQEIEEVSGQVKEKQNRLNQMLDEIEQQKNALTEQKSQIVGSLTQETQVKNELMELQVEAKSLAQEKERLKKELDENASWEVKQNQEFENLKLLLAEDEQRLQELETKFGSLRDQLTEVRTQLESLDKEMAQKSASFSEKKSKLDLLQDLKNRFEGFYQGVRAVLQEAQGGGLNGICGSVADLIQVPREYEVAIEVALGSRVQNIVAETAEDVKKAIYFLKESGGGQATFLPLDLFKAGEIYQLPERWSNPGVIGNACEFVQFDPKYYKIFKTLLGNTILVKDMDSALAVARNPGVNCQLVTLEGDAINSRGAITGGSNRNKVRGFISREGQIEELKVTVASFENEMNGFLDRRSELLQKRDELDRGLSDMQSDLHHDRVAVATKRNDIVKLETSLHQHVENRELFQKELESITQRNEANRTRQEEIQKQLESAVQLNVDLQSNMTSAEKEILEKSNAKDIVLEELTQLKISLAQVGEKEKGLQNHQDQIERAVSDQNRSLSQLKSEMKQAVHRGEEAAAKILEFESELETIQEKKMGFGSALEEAGIKRDEAASRIHEKEMELSQMRTFLSSLQDKVHSFEIKLTQEKLMLENLLAKAQEDYDINLASMEIEIPEDCDWEALEVKVNELRAKIDSMGAVNLVAIEELQELEERFAFLEKQHNDLVESKNQLMQAISKINTTMKDLFVTTFEQVRENFKYTFTKLFNGGKGDIVLAEEEGDILEAGIDIVARPPGKKLTSVSLMSGGERALTAVAVLFALFKVKPSPFCVMDELDAPLDESNIRRFVDMVKEFVQQSQFIIVTHNKRTIAASDVMYGITMEKSGISKVVSVKFSNKDQPEEVEAGAEHAAYGFAGK